MHYVSICARTRAARLDGRSWARGSSRRLVRAVQRLDHGGGRTRCTSCLDWILDYTFEKRLPLRRLLGFRPAQSIAAREALTANHPQVERVFRAWCETPYDQRQHGGRRQTFVSFAQSNTVAVLSREQARAARGKLLALDIDPDVPMEVCQALYAQSCIWDLAHDERSALCRSLEKGDERARGKLMRKSRRASEHRIEKITEVFDEMLAGAGTRARSVTLSPAMRTGLRAWPVVPERRARRLSVR